MTPRQLEILQHALGANEYGRNPKPGLRDREEFYRNHFCAGGKDEEECRELVVLGYMKPHDAPKSWRPTLFDFRGSGDIDYDLNQAWLLYKDPEDDNEYAPEYKVFLDVAKNKQGR